MESVNLYRVLGVSRDAPDQEIARAYRRLAQRYHPDLQPPERKAKAEEWMKQINYAYAVLSDPPARTRYDATLGVDRAAPVTHSAPPADEWWVKYAAYDVRPQWPLGSKWRTYLELGLWLIFPVLLVVVGLVLLDAGRVTPGFGLFATCLAVWFIANLSLAVAATIARSKGRW